jgi:hypothetical protein
MPQLIRTPPQMLRFRLRRLLWLTASAAAFAALAPLPAAADRVYHSEHLDLAAVGGAPLRSGFVQNIKAEGPRIYAHEIFVLNGARKRTVYTVTRDFFFQDPECAGSLVFHDVDIAELRTNASGNARGDVFVEPAEVAGFEGVHGVEWTVRDAAGAIAYRTSCTAVTLD